MIWVDVAIVPIVIMLPPFITHARVGAEGHCQVSRVEVRLPCTTHARRVFDGQGRNETGLAVRATDADEVGVGVGIVPIVIMLCDFITDTRVVAGGHC